MKTVILAGGRGSRLSEETDLRPKPMVEIGGAPILVHIMKIYGAHGFRDFVMAVGYLGEVIKEYFLQYHLRTHDLTVNLATGGVEWGDGAADNWMVQMIDTGKETMTGGRLHRLETLLRREGAFMLTYGDGVADIDIGALLSFHRSHGKLATVTAVRPPARFGTMTFDGDRVVEFSEKPQTGSGWINGGFFVFEPGVFDYLHGDATVLEQDPLENLARDDELMAYRHEGFWHMMDTVRDRDVLDALLRAGNAPWCVERND
ncbi:MAG: glucose-1-phosphate cytidylyltransferase [Candidatus Binatia bacterium]